MKNYDRTRITAAIAVAGIVIAGALVPLPAAAARNETAVSEKYFQDAQKYLKDGDSNAAVIQLKNALQNDRNHVAARELLGDIYLRLRNGPAAEKELKAALSRGTDSVALRVKIARAYILQGKFDAVLKELKDDGADTGVRADILQVRGRAFLGLGMRDDALESYGEAAKLKPDDIQPMLGLAKVLVSLRRLDDAEAKVDEALVIEPESTDTLVLKGELARLKQDSDGALAAFDKAIKFDGANLAARLGRATILIDQDKDDLARVDIDVIYGVVPKHPLADYLSALILAKKKDFVGARDLLQQSAPSLENYLPSVFLNGAVNYALNQLEQAADQLSRYVAAVPGNIRARKLLGATLVRKNDLSGAIKMLKPLVDSDNADAQVLALLGGAYMRTGRFTEGAELFERAVEIAPNASAIRTQLALSRLVQGAADEAVGDLEAAINIDPEARQASILLTLVHLRKGRFDEAMISAEKLRKAMPENPLAYNLIAAAQLGKGNLDDARATFEAALRIKPDFHPARMNLAQLDIRNGKIDGAVEHYKTIIEENPKHVGAMLAMADIAARQKRDADVVEWLKKASDADPKSIVPKLRLVGYYNQQRDFQRSLAVARDLDTRVPNNTRVLEALGRVEIAAKEPTAAVATFRRLVAVATTSPHAYNLLGGALVATRDFQSARRYFRRAIELDATFAPAVTALVELESREGNLDEALRLASDLGTRRPESALGSMLTGDVYMRAKQYDKAFATYREAAKLEDTGIVALRLYNAERATGQTDTALARLQKWVDSHSSAPVRHVLASSYIQYQRYDDAIRESEILMKDDGDNPVLLNNLAWLYDQKGDRRAVDLAEKALEKAPKTPEIMDTVGWILTRRGDANRGVELLRLAHEASPKQGDIAYHYAYALNTIGRKQDAVRMLERIFQANVQFSEIENARKLLRALGG